VQYICKERLRADGSKDAQTSSDDESEVEEDEEESDDEFCDRTTAPVPKWEVLAGDRAVGCSSASYCGWIRGVRARGGRTGASRPGSVDPRLARTPGGPGDPIPEFSRPSRPRPQPSARATTAPTSPPTVIRQDCSPLPEQLRHSLRRQR
jgi:hypothetical protein